MYRPFQASNLARIAAFAAAAALTPLAAADATATAVTAATPTLTQAQMLSGQPAVPPVLEDNGIEHLVGGVGSDERARIKPLVRDMNLQLVFAEKSTGAMLADVEVAIADEKGEQILKVQDSDPWVFAELEPGTYKVTAKSDKGTIEREVKVPASGRRTELFLWS
ncbi:MAG: hypothetical protein K0Q76_3175 [Panacagrimonas sp.]|jgi:hypothetical protein|nr:hypothetical protein [Panacagrimonas sp.]MCC2658067.1 hypothetical protein [Panacagrimonas sp.]